MTQYEISPYIQQFMDYAKPYLQMKEYKQSVQIKINHSLQVLEIASKISNELSHNLIFPLKLAALFHDIGRFEQVRKFGTFVDRISCNHGLLGVKVLKETKFIAHLEKEQQNIIYTAILLHNRFNLPKNLPNNYLLVTNAVRDADKVDILRVMVENYDNPKENSDMINLNVKDEAKYTPKVLSNLFNNEPISYADLQYVNDFRLLQGGWLNDIYFKSAKDIIKSKGYIQTIIKGLPDTQEMNQAKTFILNLLEI